MQNFNEIAVSSITILVPVHLHKENTYKDFYDYEPTTFELLSVKRIDSKMEQPSDAQLHHFKCKFGIA